MSETLIILGGWSRAGQSYQEIIDSTPSGWKAYFFKPSDIENPDSSFLKFLAQKKLSKVNLVGHSLGGFLAIKICLRAPERIEKLILIDSEGVFMKDNFKGTSKNFLKTHLHYGGKKAKENLNSLIRIMKSPKSHYLQAKLAYSADIIDEARDIKVPTLILWGERDLITPVDQGEKLHEAIKNSKLTILERLDHDWPLHQPGKFWENITND